MLKNLIALILLLSVCTLSVQTVYASVENTFIMVDWAVFKEKYESNDDSEFIGMAMDEEESWFAYISAEYETESAAAIVELGDLFLANKVNLSMDIKEEVENAIGLLCIDVKGPILDLKQYDDEYWIYSILSPESVLNTSKRIDKLRTTLQTQEMASDFKDSLLR